MTEAEARARSEHYPLILDGPFFEIAFDPPDGVDWPWGGQTVVFYGYYGDGRCDVVPACASVTTAESR